MMWAEKTKTLVTGKLLGSEPQNSGIEDPAICFLHSDEPHSWGFSYPSITRLWRPENHRDLNLGNTLEPWCSICDGQAAHHSLNETSMTMQSSQAKIFTDGGIYHCHVGLQAGTLH